MSQNSPSGHQSTQLDFLPETPDNDTQEQTQDSLPITYRPRISTQDPPPPTIHTRRVSIQEPPTIHTRRVSIQEPPTIHTRRVSIQEPPIIHTRRVSIQEPPIIHTRRVSIQEPPIIHTRRVSIQEPPPIIHSRRVSIQETPSRSNSPQVSTEDTQSIIKSHWASIQDTPPNTYGCCFNIRDVSSIFQNRHFSVQSPHIPLTNTESVVYTSQVNFQDHLPTIPSTHSTIQGPKSSIWTKVDVSHSIIHSPEAAIKSSESIPWTSEENLKDSLISSQFNEYTLDSNIHSLLSSSSVEATSSRFQDNCKRRHSQLPIGWRLLYGAKKISRQLSLLLSLVGMVIIGLITLGYPWIHFQVPLTLPGDPAGPRTIPINTVFFVRCPDISCLHEYDQNAYLLDFAWAFLLLASITSFCLCIILINIIFFTSSNLPMLDFSNVIISILTGTSMVLGILFYLMQAQQYLQEGMTYRLGHSFYLAWTGVFFFLMTGFFSYLNYMNFWSILAIQAIWT